MPQFESVTGRHEALAIYFQVWNTRWATISFGSAKRALLWPATNRPDLLKSDGSVMARAIGFGWLLTLLEPPNRWTVRTALHPVLHFEIADYAAMIESDVQL